ncbi:hypothetical protein CRM71_14695 [Prevotella jejuni]|nr:hypothetical protein CRM71_14695 [Prevotella jejuni]
MELEYTRWNIILIRIYQYCQTISINFHQSNNGYYAQRIIDVFEKNPNTPLNKERINDIFSFDTGTA